MRTHVYMTGCAANTRASQGFSMALNSRRFQFGIGDCKWWLRVNLKYKDREHKFKNSC